MRTLLPEWKTLLVNYGCPRSGTTFMENVLSKASGVCHAKLNEFSGLHPAQSGRGLLDLARAMHRFRVVFIRTARHPMTLVESFVATPETRRKYSDRQIVQWINGESEGTAAQRRKLNSDQRPTTALVEVRYESLGTAEGREAFVGRLCELLPEPEHNRAILLRELGGRFGRDPVRPGRLAMGVTGSVLSNDQREWFRSQLAGTVDREGYE